MNVLFLSHSGYLAEQLTNFVFCLANDDPCEAESITTEECPDVEMKRKQYNPPVDTCLGDEKTEL